MTQLRLRSVGAVMGTGRDDSDRSRASSRKGEVENQVEQVSDSKTLEKRTVFPWRISTVEMRHWVGGWTAETGIGGRGEGRAEKASEKKEREEEGKVDMRLETRGWPHEGQIETQRRRQMSGWEERAWNWDETQLAEARVDPSRRLRMWVRTSDGRSVMVVTPLPAVPIVVAEIMEREKKEECL